MQPWDASKSRRQLLRELTGAYILRPDPVSWLVAADLFEEDGNEGVALLWRRRAEWFPKLWEKYLWYWHDDRTPYLAFDVQSEVNLGEFRVEFLGWRGRTIQGLRIDLDVFTKTDFVMHSVIDIRPDNHYRAKQKLFCVISGLIDRCTAFVPLTEPATIAPA